MAENENNPSDSCDNNCSTCKQNSGCGQANTLPPRAELDVKHVILVLSGKGGVGKSTVAVNLAYALSNHGRQVGLLDLDIHGPNVPKMLGLEDHQLSSENNKIIPVRVTGSLQVISMAFLLPEKSAPVVWRGAMKAGAIRQFLEDTKWGSLDYLVVDLPPGTGDEALTIAQIAPNLRGAVIVTTPQDVSTLDSTKAITFVEMLKMDVLGVVENMSGLTCPHCGEVIDLFGKGGGERIANEHNVPFLGSIPLDPEMRKAGDEGRPFIIKRKDESPSWKAIDDVMQKLVSIVER
ncbi:MAG: Mrp/NBP35 family ATP-binding protein [Methanospirillum sp.]|uniref:Mrp/NBP35 family ATP-binding protein n=1 Tax=Methanospirillum sp. TaxID=45200 RepID=UPI00236E173A|nr:Mrp/NBP35 family ATP-binding protein [Methanospirillum sp.]MDD1730386.1 Mrp/NBP35 family ATP-binding protein [Methanospirillum sp.]